MTFISYPTPRIYDMNKLEQLEFDRNKFPNPLVTAEDYRKACEEFAIPFMQQRACICAGIVDDMHEAARDPNPEQAQERVRVLAGELHNVTEFASRNQGTNETERAIHKFIQEVIALERALEQTGEFANEPK
jgi:hypothetical protein